MPKKGGCENRLGLPHGILARGEEGRGAWAPSLKGSSGVDKVLVVLGWSYTSFSQLPRNLSGGVVVHCRNEIVHHGLGYAESPVEIWICQTIVDSALPHWSFSSAIVSLSSISNPQGFDKDIFCVESSLPPAGGVGHGFKIPQLLKCKNWRKIICKKSVLYSYAKQ